MRKAPMPLEELNTCARHLLWGACTGNTRSACRQRDAAAETEAAPDTDAAPDADTHTHKTQTRHLSFLLPPLAATTPKERVENVKRVHAPAHSLSVILDGILPVLVIHLPLLRVAEHLVGGGDLLELLNVPTLVRVVFYCCSLVRFLNLLSRTQVHERAHAHTPPPFISNSDARDLACLVCWLARGAR